MTRRAVALLLLFLLLAIIGAQTGGRLFVSLAYLLGGTLVFSWLWSWLNLRWLGLSRVTQASRTQVGRPVEERMLVHNRSVLPKLWLELYDMSELPNHTVSRVVHGLAGRRTRAWSVKTNARYRGKYRLGPMQLRSGDPFGLFTYQRDLPQTSSITIYPATYDLPAFMPPVGRLVGGESLKRRTQHVTPNFAGIRNYMPGDSLNRIHWRSTARAGHLVVKEFDEDPTADVWIVLDMHERTYAEAPIMEELVSLMGAQAWMEEFPELLPASTEYAITAAASLIRHFLEQNRSVGMISHATRREVMQPDRGLRPLTRALEFLAVLQAAGRRPLAEVLTLEAQFFTRGTTVVIVTGDTRPAWVDAVRELQRRGTRLIAVLVDPHSFDESRQDMGAVRAALAILGTPTYEIRMETSIPEALAEPLRPANGRVH